MIIILDQQNFLEQVRQHSRWKQFSYEAWQLIYDWETEINPKVAYDPVSFCCDYAEYESLEKLREDYNDIETKDDLESKTHVGYLPDGRILIRQF